MAKTRRKITESLKLVDAIVEIIDARIPMSSRNPEIDSLTAGKPRIILLNKADIADPNATAEWKKYFSDIGASVISCDCRSGKGLNSFNSLVKAVLSDKIAAWTAKNMAGRTIKLMVVGIPNVGKSSFINRMAGSQKAKVADKPGVTRGNQWFSIGGGMELLDTPGVLWPKFEDQTVGLRLAFTGAVKDVIMDAETLCLGLLEILLADYSAMLKARYGTEFSNGMPSYEAMEAIARRRGMFISGGEIDTERVSVMIIDEYRAGKLGKITLERPRDYISG
jgi:ribosome biogenesis GTPase A